MNNFFKKNYKFWDNGINPVTGFNCETFRIKGEGINKLNNIKKRYFYRHN